MGDELERYTVDGVGRIYTDHDDLWLPSVTTVLSMRPTPDALKKWKKNTENHEEITRYKANRGTLIHYECQNEFVDGDMWGMEEERSENEIREEPEKWERFKEEREWARNTWGLIKKVSSISKENVIDTETFVTNTDIGYGGQFDLLYHDPVEDETVLADLKTSKAVYHPKFPLQLTSYKKAVDVTVDRMEVIRLNPDNKDWEISSSHDWPESEETLWSQFVDLRRQLEEERMQTIHQHITDQIDEGDIESEAAH